MKISTLKKEWPTSLLITLTILLTTTTLVQQTLYSLSQEKLETLAHQEKAFESFTPFEIQKLNENRSRFEQLSPEHQEKIRSLALEINEETGAAELLVIMNNYHAWLKELPASKRAEILDSTKDDKLKKIDQTLAQQERKRFLDLSQEFERADSHQIRQWVRSYFYNHQREISQLRPNDFSVRRTNSSNPEALVTALYRRDPDILNSLPEPTADEWDNLYKNLTPEAQKLVTQTQSDEEKQELALRWIRAVLLAKRQPRLPLDHELEQFYRDQVSPQTREQLAELTHEQKIRELRTLFWNHQRNRGQGRRDSEGERHGRGRGQMGQRDGEMEEHRGRGRGQMGQRDGEMEEHRGRGRGQMGQGKGGSQGKGNKERQRQRDRQIDDQSDRKRDGQQTQNKGDKSQRSSRQKRNHNSSHRSNDHHRYR
ncbi:MAG: hypothetical protein MPJ24_07385 [Pirellulaceae bacterium]|nr:hypothetical protein [Pirellulaceae bacterium]